MPKKSFRRKGTKKSKKNRTRKQKIYNMKGCSKSCSKCNKLRGI